MLAKSSFADPSTVASLMQNFVLQTSFLSEHEKE